MKHVKNNWLHVNKNGKNGKEVVWQILDNFFLVLKQINWMKATKIEGNKNLPENGFCLEAIEKENINHTMRTEKQIKSW